jgi:predicted nuclease of restriction endonuclease-like (RecB) superfamily
MFQIGTSRLRSQIATLKTEIFEITICDFKREKGIIMNRLINKEYIRFLNEIKSRIISARIRAVQSVNKELIKLYWDIGKSIVKRQDQYKWGDSVVEKLALDLIAEFNGASGFSIQNLWRMRLLYLGYKDNAKLAQLVREIPWGCAILSYQKITKISYGKTSRCERFKITAMARIE